MFTLSIETDNAAFDYPDGPQELARILRDVADKLEAGRAGGFPRDINGNNVGEWAWDR